MLLPLGADANTAETVNGAGLDQGGGLPTKGNGTGRVGAVNGQSKGEGGAGGKGFPLKTLAIDSQKAARQNEALSELDGGIAVYCEDGAGKQTHATLRVGPPFPQPSLYCHPPEIAAVSACFAASAALLKMHKLELCELFRVGPPETQRHVL